MKCAFGAFLFGAACLMGTVNAGGYGSNPRPPKLPFDEKVGDEALILAYIHEYKRRILHVQ